MNTNQTQRSEESETIAGPTAPQGLQREAIITVPLAEFPPYSSSAHDISGPNAQAWSYRSSHSAAARLPKS